MKETQKPVTDIAILVHEWDSENDVPIGEFGYLTIATLVNKIVRVIKESEVLENGKGETSGTNEVPSTGSEG